MELFDTITVAKTVGKDNVRMLSGREWGRGAERGRGAVDVVVG